jgi:spermidine synthase
MTAADFLVLGLFFVSGASALIYEVVWSRSLTNVFGGSAFAIATVLAAYMAGLALGSTVFGKVIDRRGRPLAVYGVLEAGIGLWAILLPALFHILDHVYGGLYRSLHPGFYELSLVRFVLCFLVLLVPTTLMGGTLPVLGKFLLQNRDTVGQRAGLLYGVNTLGAVLGTAWGGYMLLPTLGLRASTLLAVVMNLIVAGLAIACSRRFPSLAVEQTDVATSKPRVVATSRTLDRAVLLVYAASGFAALAYEVAWTKTLAMVLGSTNYAFTSMLTTFLLGLSLGSFVFGRIADRARRPETVLALVQLGIPVLALATIVIIPQLPQLFVDGFQKLQGSWSALEMYRLGLAAMTMFLPTFLMGATFPLVTRLYVGREDTGKRLGRLYAANTLGAILGSFLTGFLLLPWIGRQNSILAATFVNLAATLMLVLTIGWRRFAPPMRIAVAGILVLLVPAWIVGLRPWDPDIMASGAYVYASIMKPGTKIKEFMKGNNLLFYEEGTEATVSVWNAEYTISLRTNGKIEASSHGDMLTQKMIAHLPIFYHQGEPKEALMIGLASGISVGSLLTHPLDHVETVELIPSMRRAARFFDVYNGRCLDDPRHKLVMNDGRNELLMSGRKYDVIVCEPPNPWVTGVGSLFTREFFDLINQHLNPGGVACQWVQTYQFHEEDLRTILATFVDAYPYLHVWQGAPGDLILVGSMQPLRLDVGRIEASLNDKPGRDFQTLEVLPLSQILSLFITDRDGVASYVGKWPRRSTDDNLYLEYAVPKHMFIPEGRVDSRVLDPVHVSPLPYLQGASVDSSVMNAIDRYRMARDIALGVVVGRLPSGTSVPEEALARALAIAPGEEMSLTLWSREVNERGIKALLAGRTAEAEPLFRWIARVGIKPERALALNNLGTIKFDADAIDSAGYFWNRALAEEPNYPIVLTNLATLANRRGDHEESAKLLEQATYWNPVNPPTLNNLAYQLALLGRDLKRSESLARRAVSLDPDPNHRDTLGFVLIRQKRWKEAESVLGDVVKEHPDALESWLHLGMARAGDGRTEAARDAFRTVVEQSTNPDLVAQAKEELQKL